MQVTLNFRFPAQKQQQQQPQSVGVRVLFPVPEQRPYAAANFFFMCTSELPSGDMLRALGISSSQISAPSVDALRSTGLKPFAESAVVRIEKNVMMEIGSSTSTSIFGSFMKDEPLQSLTSSSAAWQELRAGTILIGNLGMPNSNGSRYYIILQDVTSAERREELSAYQPLGIITTGLEALREACSKVSLQPRTLMPLQPVKMWASEMHYGHHGLLGCDDGDADGGGVVQRAAEKRTVAPLIAGRVRCREVMEREENDEDGNPVAKSGSTVQKRFFDFSQKYPEPAGDDSCSMPQAKRLRRESPERGAADTGSKPFDFFAVQEAVFVKDIENIVETQVVRGHHPARQRRDGGGGGCRPNRLVAPGKGKHRASTAASTRAKKVLQRRY